MAISREGSFASGADSALVRERSGYRGYASRALLAYLRGISLSTSEYKGTRKELEAAAVSIEQLDLTGITPLQVIIWIW